MDRAWTVFGNRGVVLRCGISLVLSKAVTGIKLVEIPHHAVARHLRVCRGIPYPAVIPGPPPPAGRPPKTPPPRPPAPPAAAPTPASSAPATSANPFCHKSHSCDNRFQYFALIGLHHCSLLY